MITCEYICIHGFLLSSALSLVSAVEACEIRGTHRFRPTRKLVRVDYETPVHIITNA